MVLQVVAKQIGQEKAEQLESYLNKLLVIVKCQKQNIHIGTYFDGETESCQHCQQNCHQFTLLFVIRQWNAILFSIMNAILQNLQVH